MKDKIKSYSFWTALSGAVVVFVQALGEVFGFAIESDVVSGLIMAVAGILVVFGVVSMPKTENTNSDETANNSQEENESNVENENVDVENDQIANTDEIKDIEQTVIEETTTDEKTVKE